MSQRPVIQWPAISVGWILALLALLLAVIFAAIGRMDTLVAALIGLVALSRLIP